MMGSVNKIKLWQKTDLDGFFGLFTNNLTNILVMATLLISVGMPPNIVFGFILPAVGLSIFLSSVIYSTMAYRKALKMKRHDVTALPSGTSVTHMFLVVYFIMGPVYQSTSDPYIAWYASLAWGFIEGTIELIGAFFGEKIKKIMPRTAMLGSLAGASITFIAMNPAFKIFETPHIGLITLFIILVGWFGKRRIINLPIGLFAILIGTTIGWISGNMDIENLVNSFNSLTISIPTFSIDRIMNGLQESKPFLVSAIPLGLYNIFETIDNLESAEVAGDKYNTFWTMFSDGLTSIIASMFGSPFPTAVYIGHPGWKEIGARIGYTLATGIGLVIITWVGLINLLLNAIPLEAILPILIYIGLVIGSQAFQEVGNKYIPAVVIAFIPWIADWGKMIIENTLVALNTNPTEVGFDVIRKAGVEFGGMTSLSNGSIIVSMLWASILTFIIDNKFNKVFYTVILGSIFSFFGLIHSTEVGINKGGGMAISYLLIGVLCCVFSLISKKEGNKNDKL